VAAAAFLACGQRGPVVRIAVAVPLTGDIGTEGQGILRAVTLAVEEANAAKTLPFRLAVAPYDDGGDPAQAVNVANLVVIDSRIVAVIGHYNSGCAIEAARVYARAPIAMISPSATNPQLTRQQLLPSWKGERVAFRLVPTDDVEGEFAAHYAFARLGRKKVAVIDDGTPYGRGLTGEFRKTFSKIGGRVVFTGQVMEDEKDFSALIQKLKKNAPDSVYFGGLYPAAGLLLRQIRAAGIPWTFLSGDGARTSGLFDVAGSAAEGAYATMVGVPVERLSSAQVFVENYKKRWSNEWDDMKPFDHFGYEAAQIVIAALARSGPDRRALLDSIRQIHHHGILGVTTFDEKGDTTNRIITMMQARSADRSFVVVE
jgi:branched-chain amino acid transport system substrate-binding protein